MENEYPLCLANGISLRFPGSSMATVCKLLPSHCAGAKSCAARRAVLPHLTCCLGMHAHRPPLVRSFPPTFQVGREFVPGEGRAFLNANTMKPEEIHVSGDRELPARLTLLAHIELISAGVLPLVKAEIPDLHEFPLSGR